MLDTKFWKKYFEVYDVLNSLIPYQELLDTVCEELDIKKGDRVLEAGCGTCNLALKIKEKGASVVGLDNSQVALNICREKDLDLEVVLADLTEELPFADNYFDKITCNNVLYTLPEEAHTSVLKEFKRVLKKGGRIVISNVRKDWKPLAIYVEGIRLTIAREGLIKAFLKVMKLLIPTVRILYYNYLIARERKYYFFAKGEQGKLLERVGFSRISDAKSVYVNQAFLTSGFNT